MTVSLPARNERLLIVGRTGSGKTVFALFALSQADFDLKPWVIIDFKGDENLNSIQGAEYIGLDTVPRLPGIYIVRPRIDQKGEVEAFLWRIWETENIGVFVDEGYMLGQGASFSPAFRAILTQGRSKNIPVILNSQRPVWLDVFAKTETNKLAMFHLNSVGDRKVMAEMIGAKAGPDVHERLDKWHSIYYDIDTDTAIELGPAPSPDASLSLIDLRLAQIKQARQNPQVSKATPKRYERI